MDLARTGWKDIWSLCGEILISYVKTLKHLCVDGPDLQKIADEMDLNSLNQLRLETLRFRMSFDPTRFRDVLGLTLVAPGGPASPGEDASTSLRRIEFRDFDRGRQFNRDIDTSAWILQYMRTPNLKRFQMFSWRNRSYFRIPGAVPLVQHGLEHLSTFQGLEFADFQSSVDTGSFLDRLQSLSLYHGKTLHTMKMDAYSFDASQSFFIDLSPLAHFDVLKRIELTHNHTSLCFSLSTLWQILPLRPTITEVHLTMYTPTSNPRPIYDTTRLAYTSYIVLPQRLLTPIYSTAFYLHNTRSRIKTSSFLCGNTEIYPSTRVVTPYRSMLGESGCDRLHINTYLSGMFYTKRLRSEIFKYPEPQREMPANLFKDVELFHLIATTVPGNLELFQLEYVHRAGMDGRSSTKRMGDGWRKVEGEWLYEKQVTPVLPW
ncbi:hypothetical protein AA313_de0201124 [Arthrobotrys entomopaga]|nr:hypothetical protein AA313_de0201124 [Arthrobotrys entomopaga]